MPLAPQQLLNDNLMLERELGRGGMGSVWRARNLTLDSEVAVKVLLAERLDQPGLRERFVQEARGSAQQDHPHVVKVFDFGVTSDGDPYLVMELLRGEDLGQRIERAGPLSIDDTIVVLNQTCQALARAHGHEVVHRDLKPANLFLLDDVDDIFVKVLDFGIAKFRGADTSHKTATGALLGSPHYMSPEQVMDASNVDLRTDLWAMAAVVHTCLTGEPPFDGPSIGAISVAIHGAQHPSVRQARPELPATIEEWFDKALSKQPSGRHDSAKELAATFAAAAAGIRECDMPPLVDTASAPRAVIGGTGAGRGRDHLSALAATEASDERPPAAVSPADALAPTAASDERPSAMIGQGGGERAQRAAEPQPPSPAVTGHAAEGATAGGQATAPGGQAAGAARHPGIWVLLAAVVAAVVGGGIVWLGGRPQPPAVPSVPPPPWGTGRAHATAQPTITVGATHLPSPSASSDATASVGASASASSAPGPAGSGTSPTAAPSAEPTSAKPPPSGNADVSGGIAEALKCWRGNEGRSGAGTPASSVTFHVTLNSHGTTRIVRVSGPASNDHPHFTRCCVLHFARVVWGDDPQGPVTFSVHLSASPPSSAP